MILCAACLWLVSVDPREDGRQQYDWYDTWHREIMEEDTLKEMQQVLHDNDDSER